MKKSELISVDVPADDAKEEIAATVVADARDTKLRVTEKTRKRSNSATRPTRLYEIAE